MWDAIVSFLSSVLESISLAVGDWGLGIIILTIVIRLILTPLSIKQTQSTARTSVLQPKIQELQERYADDPERLSNELRTFYSENNINPLGGCLPLIVQMPILFALFSVLRNLPASDDVHFYNIISDLTQSASGAFSEGGFASAWIYMLLVLLFGVLVMVPMMLNAGDNPESRSTTLTTGGLMAIMMMWLGWTLPAGVLLYYDISSAWGVVQQVFVTKRVKERVVAEEQARLANEPISVNVVRREKKQRPHKKS